MERLQKVIARSGIASRRKAEELMTQGKVKVNGEIVKELGTKVTSKDIVMVNNKVISIEEFVYYVLYKPEGYVSTTDDEKDRRKVTDLINDPRRIYPVGRLDFDTSGVLLLTNDGAFTNQMTSPKHHVEKEYEVKMKGFLRKEESLKLSRGILIDKYMKKKQFIKNVENSKTSKT